MEDKLHKVVLPRMAASLLIRGGIGIALFNRNLGLYPSSYNISRKKQLKRKRGQRTRVSYEIDKEYEPELTFSLRFEEESDENPNEYVSARIYRAKKTVYLTCEKTFSTPIEFLLLDKNNPEIYAERILDCEEETYEERYGQILTDSFEEGKPLSFQAGIRTYLEEERIQETERNVVGKVSFENYPLLNLLDAKPIDSEIYYYESDSYDNKRDSIEKRKKKRSDNLEDYFKSRSDGKTLFSYEKVKEIRSFSYLGKEEGITKKIVSPLYARVFFDRYVQEMKNGNTPIVFSIESEGIELDKKELGFKNIPSFVDSVEIGEGNIVF